MVSPTNHAAFRAAYHPPAQSRVSGKENERDAAGENRASSRSQPRQNILSLAMDMQDDLSALLPSLRQRRQEAGGAPLMRSGAWIEHVLDDQAPKKCAEAKRQLLSEEWGAARILDELGQLFPDSSDLMAALNALIEDSELCHLREELARARARNIELLGPRSAQKAKAGLNAALKAKLGSDHSELTPVLLRGCYRDFMEGNLEPMGQYELWIEQYGFKCRYRVLGFIEQALAADMYSLDPSCSRLEFGNMLHRVRTLSTLRSADEMLITECDKQAWARQVSLVPLDMIKAIFSVVREGGGIEKLFDGPLSAARFQLGPADKVRMAQTLRWAFKALPYSLWYDVEFQIQVLNELESVVAAAIAIENRNDTTSMRWSA